ncbi:AAA family ATPase [Pseudomonas sp. ZY71]|uniref:AAA family ATPase n=1 Tax=Pseudomonas sp. ZY71 TaxID=3115647 RepID=UPI002F42A4B9
MLISKIKAESKAIQMREGGSAPNIFDVCSLSLLIGPNGSGKSMLLKRIVDFFCGRFNQQISCGLEVELQNRETLSKLTAFEDWGVIYYSLIPYAPVFGKADNFVDASPRRVSQLDVREIAKHVPLIERFGFRPYLKLQAQLNTNSVINDVIGFLFQEDLISEIFPDHTDFDQLREIKNDSAFDSEIFRMRSQLYSTCRSELIDRLLHTSDTTLTYAALLVIQKIITKESARNTIVSICSTYLGVPLKVDSPFMQNNSHRRRLEGVERVASLLARSDYFDKNKRRKTRLNSKPDFFLEMHLDEYFGGYSHANYTQYFTANLEGMSSGQAALISQFCRLSTALVKVSKVRRNVLVLIDEGDAFLHLEWQRIYIQQLNQFLADEKQALGLEALQVIMTTHSPILATDVPKQFICQLDELGGSGAPPLAFAATLHALLNRSFHARTIGEFASQRINELIENLKQGRFSERDRAIMECIDNPLIQDELKRLMAQGVNE